MAADDWDINDQQLPHVLRHDYFRECIDGHIKLVYPVDCEDAKRHASGWAMRNTNNHNVSILKKSCLGVLLCSKSCTNELGEKVHMRPAICDKARKKQQNRHCPNPYCNGRLVVMPCRGHSEYPVTHFWRHTPQGIFFQAKGIHDHPLPEHKISPEVRKGGRTASKQKIMAPRSAMAWKKRGAIQEFWPPIDSDQRSHGPPQTLSISADQPIITQVTAFVANTVSQTYYITQDPPNYPPQNPNAFNWNNSSPPYSSSKGQRISSNLSVSSGCDNCTCCTGYSMETESTEPADLSYTYSTEVQQISHGQANTLAAHCGEQLFYGTSYSFVHNPADDPGLVSGRSGDVSYGTALSRSQLTFPGLASEQASNRFYVEDAADTDPHFSTAYSSEVESLEISRNHDRERTVHPQYASYSNDDGNMFVYDDASGRFTVHQQAQHDYHYG